MNIRLLALVASVTLLSMSSGCCGLKNFMFGRGARCGLCQRLSAPLSNPAPAYAPQAPCGTAPYAPAPYTPAPYAAAPYAPAAPTCSQPVVTAPSGDCGCNGYAYGGDVSYGSAYSGGCECEAYGGGTCLGESYGGVVHDPYLSSGTVVPYSGQVIDGGIVGDQVIPGTSYPSSPAQIQPDDFGPATSRKFDTDGNKILWEEPLPPGATPQ